MIIHVDAAAPLPVFEQMRSQIERLIASGQMRAGTKLPTIRQLAHDLGVARGTVNKVYDALARDGLVETAGRHGTIVRAGPALTTTSSDLDAAADTVAVVTRQLGFDDQAAHVALNAALERLPTRPD
jgi:DNA-binding transcriptional regulator YhcF (GntR family)